MIKQINNSKESGGSQPYQQNRVYDTDGELPTINTGNGGNTVHKILIKSNTISGEETAKEGDTINYSQPNSKTRRGRVWVGVAQTLDTQVNQGVVIPDEKRITQNGHGFMKQYDADFVPAIMGSSTAHNVFVDKIRRLTETECERLQGFPDGWTKMGNYDGQIKEISRTQRYKMCGNAVTTNIVQLIGIKLLNQ